MNKRKICIVTGSRADYGHLKGVIEAVNEDRSLILQLVATGSHLSAQQGNTYRMISKDGFCLSAKVPVLSYNDSDVGISKRIGLGCQRFADVFSRLQPDIVVVLGDRYEILAATIAAYVGKRVIAHIHGGEASEGVLDEAFRHAITKMAHVHFTAAEEYRRRVIQLGEQPKNVFNVGAPGLDALKQIQYLSREELSEKIGFDLSGRVAIMTYHPVTLEKSSPKRQLETILKAIHQSSLKVIFTAANTDAQGRVINRMLAAFCKKYPGRYKFVDNLGQQKYMSCLNNFDLMIGNSSSGIIESPSFALPVVNVGDRQKGRLRARNIIDVACEISAVQKGIALALSDQFRKSLKAMENPYGLARDGRVSWRIKEQLRKIPINEQLIRKEFFDVRFEV